MRAGRRRSSRVSRGRPSTSCWPGSCAARSRACASTLRAPTSPSAGGAAAEAVVGKRDEDGRYAFVEIECGLDVDLDPLPEGDQLVELLDLAERDCFVGASLKRSPRYEWRVNGELIR